MKKVIAVGVLSLCLLVIGGCKKDTVTTDRTSDVSADVAEAVTDDSGMFRGGLQELLAMGKPQKCEWKGDGESGTTYVDGKRMRADMVGAAVVDGAQSTMSMVNDGTWMYSWDTVTKKGQKFKVADMEKMQKRFEGMNADMMDDMGEDEHIAQDYMEQEHAFDCKKWRVDEKLFTPPSDIVFEDMGAMIEQAQEALKGLSGQCDSLPEAQRSACVEAMKKFAQ